MRLLPTIINTISLVLLQMSIGIALLSDFGIERAVVNNEMYINSSGLSLTSVKLNPTNTYSEWVNRLMGPKSLMWHQSKGFNLDGGAIPTFDDRKVAHDKMKIPLTYLPSPAYTPGCSIEFLGFVPVETEKPFTMSYKNHRVSSGKADLVIGSAKWPCFYRATWDNWRKGETENTKPNFWPIFLYCYPVNPEESCTILSSEFLNSESGIIATISLLTRSKTIWQASISVPKQRWTDVYVGDNFLTSENLNDLNKRKQQSSHDLAVCTCIPYTTSDTGKLNAMEVILYEWVQYYAKLDVKLMIYDRNALHEDKLLGTAYAQRHFNSASRADKVKIRRNLKYHAYSMLGSLDSNPMVVPYDNTEGVSDLLVKYDNDHTLSLTQCRFEAAARYGIDKVIAIDFDEFLYCSDGGYNATSQSAYIHKMLELFQKRGYDQLTFLQRTVANQTASVRDCVIKQAESEQGSIFSCFAPFRFGIDDFAPKSVHLTNGCPLTTDHHATPISSSPRIYDCVGTSYQVHEDVCAMVHLTLRLSDYTKSSRENFNLADYTGKSLEIGQI